jgi:PAS domain S-box-containing protein
MDPWLTQGDFETDARYRLLIEHSPMGVIVHSDGKIVLVNRAACRLLKASDPSRLMGNSLRSILHEKTPEASLAAVSPDGEASANEPIEARFIRLDGEVLYVELMLSSMDFDGLSACQIVFSDITSRRKALQDRIALETKIQQAQKLESLGILAGGIAHDFNNLLVGVLGNAALALLDLPPESPARQYVQHIETTAIRAAELIQQMLAYSGKGHFLVERIDLESLVTQMTHLLSISISKKAVLKYDFAPNVPPVDADAAQVRQVVMNLVTNASEAIGDRSGVITICTGAMDCDRTYLQETYLDDDLFEGLYSYIEVADSGCGMDATTKERVFDPFFSTKFTGRGLGLAAVLGIVRGHRGAIKIYTEKSKGTTIKVLFPSIQVENHRSSEAPKPPIEGSAGGRVLLVDDEETVRAVGKNMLERLGFEVTTACNGKEALDIFQAAPNDYRFVLLDLTMPILGGEQCFRELRRIRKDVVVVLSSGYNEQELIARFAGKGFAGFIQKPYRLEYLNTKLQEALKKALSTAENGLSRG